MTGRAKRTTGPGIVALAACAGAVLLAGCATGMAQEAQGPGDVEWTGRLDAGSVIEVRGVNGSVEATAAPEGRARVRARMHGPEADVRRVRVEVVEHDGGVTLCAVYLDSGRDDGCRPGGGGQSVRDNEARVDFEVAVPAGIRFSGHTVNGGVRVRELDGNVEVSTVNGDVEVSTRGAAEARTVNGSIRAGMERAPESPLDFETVNGRIELDLPGDADADVEAEWVNGGLESDLPLRVTGRISRRRAKGRLGQGGPLLRLSTVNGSIHIR